MSSDVYSSKFKDLWAISLDVKQNQGEALGLFLDLVEYCEAAKTGNAVTIDNCKQKILAAK